MGIHAGSLPLVGHVLDLRCAPALDTCGVTVSRKDWHKLMPHVAWLPLDADQADRLQRELWCERHVPAGYWFVSREPVQSLPTDDTDPYHYQVFNTAFCFFRQEDWMNFRLSWE